MISKTILLLLYLFNETSYSKDILDDTEFMDTDCCDLIPSPIPSPMYSPIPSSMYSPIPSPMYSPIPSPMYSPLPSPTSFNLYELYNYIYLYSIISPPSSPEKNKYDILDNNFNGYEILL